MIWYDSHRVITLLKWRGSIIPKSMLWAAPSAALALAMRYLDMRGYIELNDLSVLSQGDVYSGFTFVLGFSLVFRTSQAYLRYWTAATSVHEMTSEWGDSCASLIAFARTDAPDDPTVMEFRHTVVRLFSLMHAMALTEIANIGDCIPLLDINGLSKEQLVVLTQGHAQGKKVQIVMSWIKAYIIEMGDVGVLKVPAPILTRVFQELGDGLVNYHKALHIVIWPFPFPYTQLNFILIQVYTILTPLVVSTWGVWAWLCSVFTFVSVTCMVGLDLIACELENPFGDDPNDLPVLDMQKDMNKFLTMQLHPAVHSPPRLLPTAIREYKTMVIHCTNVNKRFGTKDGKLPGLGGKEEAQAMWNSSGSLLGATLSIAGMRGSTSSTPTMTRAGSRLIGSTRWRGLTTTSTNEEEIDRMRAWLGCPPMSDSESEETDVNNIGSSPTKEDSYNVAMVTCEDEGLVASFAESAKSGPTSSVSPLRSRANSRANSPTRPLTPSQRGAGGDDMVLPVRRSIRASARFNMMHAEDWDVARQFSRCKQEFAQDMKDFLDAFDEKLRAIMDHQIEVQRRENRALERLLRGSARVSARESLSPENSIRGDGGSLTPLASLASVRGRRSCGDVSGLDSDSDMEATTWPPNLPRPLLMSLAPEMAAL